MKNKLKTSLGFKFYIILCAVSVFFIVVHIVDELYDGVGLCILNIGKIVIEILAFGMLPAVVLTCLTDVVNTNIQQKNYDEYIKNNKAKLKMMCYDLPSDLLVSINQSPDTTVEENEERKTFVQWCEVLFDYNNIGRYKQETECFLEYIHNIRSEANKYLESTSGYQASIDENERQKERIRINNLMEACKCFKVKMNIANEKINYKYNFDRFVKAVIDVFPELKKDYIEGYNSEDFM